MSTWAAPRPSASCTVDSALLSERIVVAMDQYAALSDAVATRIPVEMRFCVTAMFLFVCARVCRAVIAAVLVRRLLISRCPSCFRFVQGHTGSAGMAERPHALDGLLVLHPICHRE